MRRRDPEAYAEHLAMFTPCATCGTRRNPRSGARQMAGCECGESRCIDTCHEERTCCGEHAPVACPNPHCGDVAEIEFTGTVYIVGCASACFEDARPQPWGFADNKLDAIADWNESVEFWLDGRGVAS